MFTRETLRCRGNSIPFSALYIREFAVGIWSQNLPQELAVAICREKLSQNVPREFATGICRGYLPREFAIGICHRSFPWKITAGIFHGYLPWVYCICERILFCICERILFIWKQTFFIIEQNLFICEIFFFDNVSFCYCCGNYEPPYSP